jgi:endothelin-converting enzyme/putative endopeptidase
MRARFLLLGPTLLALAVAACGAPPDADEAALTAEDLATLATPGVDENALDRSVDPCTDFYAFACGGWIAAQPPDTKDALRSYTELAKDRRALFGQVIDAIRKSPKTSAEAKAGAYASSCLADPSASAAKATAALVGFRSEIEAATTPDAIARVLARMHRRGLDAFFTFGPQVDMERQGRHGSASVIPGGLSVFTEYDDDGSRADRIAALGRIFLTVEPGLGDDEATRLATAAAGIEGQLFLAIAAIDPEERPHPIGRPGLETAMPHVAWDAYFGELGRTDLPSFDVDGLSYMATVDQILTSASPSDLHAYLTGRWYEAMTSAIASVPADPAAHQSFCQNQLAGAMADAIEPRFLALAGVDAKAKAKAKVLLDALIASFDATLGEGDSFLDVPTRIEARAKLGKIRTAVGSSRTLDDFRDVALEGSEPWVLVDLRLRERAFDHAFAMMGKSLPLLHVDLPSPIINATYDTTLNKINIPGGILGGYFFSASAPALANFSALGAVLGHELTHGFDNHGRHVDGDGVLRDWFSPSVETEFQTRAKCLIDQYDGYTLDGVPDPHTHQIPAHVSGRLTIAENIADNGGIKTAYRASKVDGLAAPVRAGLTPAQQFFVGYAQLWCAKTAPDVASQNLASDIHSPPRARVNLPLANFDAFASAFQCKAGTPMAPAERCGVW